MTETGILIVGGSLNGLTTALLLAHRKVPCLVVERHAETSVQYKFRGISPRSVGLSQHGVEADIRRCDSIDERSAIARTKNLADREITWQGVPWAILRGESTDARCDRIAQPILKATRSAALTCGSTPSWLGDRTPQRHRRIRIMPARKTVRAATVAADGTHGTVRDAPSSHATALGFSNTG